VVEAANVGDAGHTLASLVGSRSGRWSMEVDVKLRRCHGEVLGDEGADLGLVGDGVRMQESGVRYR
jgi:hypothetical protein